MRTKVLWILLCAFLVACSNTDTEILVGESPHTYDNAPGAPSTYSHVAYLHWNVWYDRGDPKVDWQVGIRHISTTTTESGKLVLLDSEGDELEEQPNITVHKKMTAEQYVDRGERMDIILTLFSLKGDEEAILADYPPLLDRSKKYVIAVSTFSELVETEDISEVVLEDDGTYTIHLNNGNFIAGVDRLVYGDTLQEALDNL